MVPADVTDADQVAQAYEAVEKAWGAVDVLEDSDFGPIDVFAHLSEP